MRTPLRKPPGPQPPLTQPQPPLSPFLGLSTASLALPAGRAATQGSYKTLRMKAPAAREKKKLNPHLKDRLPTPYKDKKLKLLSALVLAVFLAITEPISSVPD